ncbi:SDR family oxidoreductase [Microbacterium sp. NPDC078428]|uniref:SDR family oxidoreductase n=1 Tax=Microbacterium sp. NPDC078428 TaxID=3364190 RepID=UPI0037C6CD91
MSDPNDRAFGRMDGRVALVTGASSGIGEAIVRSFLDAGARVHAVARRGMMVEDSVGLEAIEAGRVVVHALDVGDKEAMLSLGAELERSDPIDTLVCAAGVNVTARRMAELTPESWEQLVDTNLHGVFFSIRATLGQIRERAGDVVVISSVTATWPDHAGGGYGATKSGVLGLARGLSIDEHMNGVRVTSILPGIVNTPILDKRPIPPSDELRAWCLQPEDVATATLVAVTMPARANVAEMTLVATRLQALGKTQLANPELPDALRASAS